MKLRGSKKKWKEDRRNRWIGGYFELLIPLYLAGLVPGGPYRLSSIFNRNSNPVNSEILFTLDKVFRKISLMLCDLTNRASKKRVSNWLRHQLRRTGGQCVVRRTFAKSYSVNYFLSQGIMFTLRITFRQLLRLRPSLRYLSLSPYVLYLEDSPRNEPPRVSCQVPPHQILYTKVHLRRNFQMNAGSFYEEAG